MQTLIDTLLEKQATLSAVERFAQKHEFAASPILEKTYRDLIPIRKPATGEQYAFSVDLDACTGCKACVVACHSLNGLAKEESWRDIGHIVSLDSLTGEQQTVTSACHHCADPACMNGCPTRAYEKLDSGIVRHLDDQCIGCSYCQLKCPYDVPKYNKELGIVRKCDMCVDRLEVGEAPACVQSCPNGAIKISIISEAEIAQQGSTPIVAGAFDSDYTKPTTRFHSKRINSAEMQTMRAADAETLQPADAHLPLVSMLVLTQAAAGHTLVHALAQPAGQSFHLIVSFLLALAGLLCAGAHLGSPLGAWKAFLGLRHSWLSREIILFGLWMPLLGALAFHSLFPDTLGKLPLIGPLISETLASPVSLWGTCLLGAISVFSSMMVYIDTRRNFWSAKHTVSRFAGSALLLGTSSYIGIEAAQGQAPDSIWLIAFTIALLTKFGIELPSLLPAYARGWSDEKHTAKLQLGPLRKLLYARTLCWLVALFSPLILFSPSILPLWAGLQFLAVLGGEWFERRLYFQAVVRAKMPGHFQAQALQTDH